MGHKVFLLILIIGLMGCSSKSSQNVYLSKIYGPPDFQAKVHKGLLSIEEKLNKKIFYVKGDYPISIKKASLTERSSCMISGKKDCSVVIDQNKNWLQIHFLNKIQSFFGKIKSFINKKTKDSSEDEDDDEEVVQEESAFAMVGPKECDIIIHQDSDWSSDYFTVTLYHEIGHCLGLDHPPFDHGIIMDEIVTDETVKEEVKNIPEFLSLIDELTINKKPMLKAAKFKPKVYNREAKGLELVWDSEQVKEY